ncbi:MAG: hypothetical protein ACQEP2_09180 [Actinomycetota bacterium]
MSPLGIVGITTLIFIGSLVVVGVMVAISFFRLSKNMKRFSSKVDKEVMPSVNNLKDAAEKLDKEMKSFEKLKGRAAKAMEELNGARDKIRILKKNSTLLYNTINLLKK